jgi:hypothetical protein
MLLTRGHGLPAEYLHTIPYGGPSHDLMRASQKYIIGREQLMFPKFSRVYGFVRDNVGRDTCSWRAATDGRSGGCAHETYTRRRFEQRCGRSTANAARASTHLGVRTNPPHNARGTAVVVSAGSAGRRRVGAAAELLSAQDASQGARAATSTWRRRQGQWQQGRQECAHVALPSAR